jgi:hypothetical protein
MYARRPEKCRLALPYLQNRLKAANTFAKFRTHCPKPVEHPPTIDILPAFNDKKLPGIARSEEPDP